MSNEAETNEDDVQPSDSQQQLYFAKIGHAPLLLRLAADMFRQHSDLFLQQAATLERISACPADPESWNLTEPSPESIQASLQREQITSLAIKSYESMCQVQKRVDYMEQLMMRNGVGTKIIPKVKKPPVPKLHANKAKQANTPLFWLTRDHGERLAQEFGSENVKHELIKLWASMNPAQRRPYVLKAETTKREKVRAKKEPTQERKGESIDGGGGGVDDPTLPCAQNLSKKTPESSSFSDEDDE
jgi:hypothetical protein